MKILVVCQYYNPEPFRISDLCEELVKCGNEVTVVTGTPNYPMGEIYEGYENGAHTDEVIRGVRVHRCKIHPRKKGVLHRLWNYYSFSYQSKKYVKTLDSSFDLVFIYQLSPVMMADAGIYYAKKHNKRSVLYCLDLWPASIGAGGITGGIVYRWFYRESKRMYRAVDKILVSSKSFAKYFEEQFDIKNTEYLPQYAETTFTPQECKKTPNEYIDLMFAGNVGTAQSVDTVIKAAAICKDIPNLRWHVVGDGIEWERCRSLARELDAPVIFHGRRPIEEMPRYYAMADAMLVTMKKDPILSLTLPGKVQSYMAAGKPIIGAIDGEAKKIICEADCGLCCEVENQLQLAAVVRTYFANTALLKQHATNSYKYYADFFDKSKVVDALVRYLRNEKHTGNG